MLEVVIVKKEEKQILMNLIEKYEYDFSKYTLADINNLGLFGYDYLDHYFVEENRFAYFVKVDGFLAGFVMINDYPEVKTEKTDYCISEFFILSKYRRQGIGKKVVFEVLNKHRGRWMLKRHPKNIDSVLFWDNVISDYTKGNFTLIKAHPNESIAYEDGSLADVIFFDN